MALDFPSNPSLGQSFTSDGAVYVWNGYAWTGGLPLTVATPGVSGLMPGADKTKLDPIRGMPPDLIDLPDMCPFLPRCDYAREKCEQQNPPLLDVNADHRSACWFWEEVSKEGPKV